MVSADFGGTINIHITHVKSLSVISLLRTLCWSSIEEEVVVDDTSFINRYQ